MRHTARMHSDSLYHRHRFPAENHQSQRLVVFSLRTQFSRCRRNVSDARSFTHIRNSQRMVPQVWPELRQLLATPSSSPGRSVAP